MLRFGELLLRRLARLLPLRKDPRESTDNELILQNSKLTLRNDSFITLANPPNLFSIAAMIKKHNKRSFWNQSRGRLDRFIGTSELGWDGAQAESSGSQILISLTVCFFFFLF
ncbi:hypothetical protein EON65_49965 [archaeon]|nr:MAG: hypothetical protein EON65_49965 [archaeon]